MQRRKAGESVRRDRPGRGFCWTSLCLHACNPFIVFHSHLRVNDCSNFRIPSFFIECESTASAEGEQRLARAKLKRAWNLLCRTETKQPRTRKNQRQISRETLCVPLSFFFGTCNPIVNCTKSQGLLRITGIKDGACELWWFDILSIPPSLNTLRDMTSLWNSGAHCIEVRLRNCGGMSLRKLEKWLRKAKQKKEQVQKEIAMRHTDNDINEY